jgi:hypothetical protein
MIYRKLAVLFTCTLSLLLFFACSSSKTLTRGKAKDMIEQNDWSRPGIVRFHPTQDEIAAGMQKGVWKTTPAFGGTTLEFSPIGKSCFSGYSLYYGYFESSTKFGQKIEVTGITDPPEAAFVGSTAGSAKDAEFDWNWDYAGCAAEVREIFKNHVEKGKARFQLYDEGWRLRKVRSLSNSSKR